MSLDRFGNREIAWSGPDPAGRLYFLRAGQEEIGSLRFEDESGTLAVGALEGGEWIFERSGALHPRVQIRSGGSEQSVAELNLRWTGSGVVSFVSGARYCWQTAGLLSSKWCLRRLREDRLICFVHEGGLSSKGARVIPCADCAGLPEFPVLVLLGWYLRVLMTNRLSHAAVSCEQ